MSSSRDTMRWMSPRSMGVMNDLCSISSVWWATVSASCSTCLMRLAPSSAFFRSASSACNSLAPSTESAACLEKKSKNSVFCGSNRPSMVSLGERVGVEHAAVERLGGELERASGEIEERVAVRLLREGGEGLRRDVVGIGAAAALDHVDGALPVGDHGAGLE